MKGLIKFANVMDKITEWIGGIPVILVVITVALTFYNVVVRRLDEYMGTQLSKNTFLEMQWYLYSLVFFLSFAYILKNGINVRVDFIYTNWTKKRKAALDFWGHLLFLLPFCLLAIQVSISPVLTSWGRLPNGSWGTWELSPDPGGLPRAPIKTMIIVAFVLLLLQTIAELIKLWAIMRERDDLVDVELDSETPIRIE